MRVDGKRAKEVRARVRAKDVVRRKGGGWWVRGSAHVGQACACATHLVGAVLEDGHARERAHVGGEQQLHLVRVRVRVRIRDRARARVRVRARARARVSDEQQLHPQLRRQVGEGGAALHVLLGREDEVVEGVETPGSGLWLGLGRRRSCRRS